MFLHWHHRLCRRAGGSGPAQSWPGTITTRWAAWRVRSCSAAAAPPSAEEDCCDPQGPPLPVVKLRNPLNNVPRVFICSFFGGVWVVCFVLFCFLIQILHFITTALILLFLYISIKCPLCETHQRSWIETNPSQ